MCERRQRIVSLLFVFAALSVSATLLKGIPDNLPGIALELPFLLHAERAAAIFAILLAATSVFYQGWQGRLPDQFSTSGLGYQLELATEKSGRTFDKLETQVQEQAKKQKIVLQLLSKLEAEFDNQATIQTDAVK